MYEIDVGADAVHEGHEAFGVLVRRYRRELYAHCLRMLGTAEEAEDAVQDAFLKAWRSRASFAGAAAARTWLYRIATNVCIDAAARRARRRTLRFVRAVERPEPEPAAVVAARETIEEGFLAIVLLLPPRQRAVLILRELLGWSAAETAELLATSPTAVNSALQRARATLRAQLPDAPSEPPNAREQRLLTAYATAHERTDPKTLLDLVQADVHTVA